MSTNNRLRILGLVALRIAAIIGGAVLVCGFVVIGLDPDIYYRTWAFIYASIGAIVTFASCTYIEKLKKR